MGGRFRVHPLIVIFAVLAGNQIHGVVGMFLAIPLIPLVKETIVFMRPRLVLRACGLGPSRPSHPRDERHPATPFIVPLPELDAIFGKPRQGCVGGAPDCYAGSIAKRRGGHREPFSHQVPGAVRAHQAHRRRRRVELRAAPPRRAAVHGAWRGGPLLGRRRQRVHRLVSGLRPAHSWPPAAPRSSTPW